MKIKSSTCKCCGQIKIKNVIKLDKKISYVDENNRLWLGKYCPDCKKQYNKQYKKENPDKVKYKRKDPVVYNKICKVCNSIFETNFNKKLYCSSDCTNSAILKRKKEVRRKFKSCVTCGKENLTKSKYCSKECKPVPPKPIKELITKTCPTCKKEFKGNSNKKFCKKGCQINVVNYRNSPAARKLRKERKLVTKFKQPISKKFKKEIIALYKNRPEGYDLDHIIPINHPDVCGLHVPWNLTYLDKSSNQIKSNQFDYTMENSSWKNFKKVV